MRTVLTALTHDLIRLHQKQFFSLPKKEREQKLGGEFGESLDRYLVSVSADEAQADVIEAFQWLKRPGKSAPRLIEALAEWICADFIRFTEGEPVSGAAALTRAVQTLMKRHTAHELLRLTKRWVELVPGFEVVVVQTSTRAPGDVRAGIRDSFLKKNPRTLVLFYTEESLLGGVRVFTATGLYDASWKRYLEKLRALVP